MREVVGSSPAGVNFFFRFGHLLSTPFFALYCMCFCQLYTRDISNSNSFDVLCKHARACRISENDRLLFVRFKQRDASRTKDWIQRRDGKKQNDKYCAARRLQLELPPHPVLGVNWTHNRDDDNVTQKPIVWPARTKKEDHRNGSTMQLPVDLRVRNRPPEKKNSSVIQLPVDLRVRTRPPEKKNSSVKQLPSTCA